MSYFLPAAMINETLEEICEKITDLKLLVKEKDEKALLKGLIDIEEVALDLWVFIERFQCQPLIYTGKGNTDEIIKRLDWAITFSEDIDPAEIFKQSPKKIK